MSGVVQLVFLMLSVIGFCPASTASMKKDLSRQNVNKTLDLVNVLQQDLRKNNDDYKDVREAEKPNPGMHNPYLTGDVLNSDLDTKDENAKNDARRNEEINTNNSIKNQNGNLIDYARRNLGTKQKTNDKEANPNEKTSISQLKSTKSNKQFTVDDKKLADGNKKSDDKTTTKPNDKNFMLHDKNSKANNQHVKLQDIKSDDAKPHGKPSNKKTTKHFYLKTTESTEGEEGLDDDRSDKMQANRRHRIMTVPDARINTATKPNARRKRIKFDKLRQLLDKEGLLKKYLKNLPAGETLRNRAYAISSDVDAPPPPDTVPSAELDMLPATGERVQTLRRKGRLCYRHILFPEGPKYNSKGKVYEQAHEVKMSHRNFENTRAPKQVLPKCCNCCKKSVLGCE